MKFRNEFEPKLKDRHQERALVSTFVDTKELPEIEMKLLENVVAATVKFKFYKIKSPIKRDKSIKEALDTMLNSREIVVRVIQGTSDLVYEAAAKQASKISLSLSTKFNNEWQKSLMHLLNKPSKNKTILNLGLYKNNNYGIFDIEHPKNLLQRLMSENDIQKKDLATLAGVNEATLYRHLSGETEISRDIAVKYAKVLGCDPAKILFNDLVIPVWGSTDTLEQGSIERLSVLQSEIIASENLGVVECPREIYRPDIKAIKFDNTNSHLHGQIAFYYNSNKPIVLEDQIVVVGVNLKNFRDNEIRQRYFIGIYKKNKDGKTIDIHSLDPSVIDISGITPDEDINSYDDFVGVTEDQRVVIDGISPTFVAPVVSIIDPIEVYSSKKTSIQKAYNEIYTQNRSDEISLLKEFKNQQMLSKVKDNLDYYMADDPGVDDYLDHMNHQKLKALIAADEKLQSVISTAAYGKAKFEKKINIKDEAKRIKAELSAEEEKIVSDAIERIQDQMDEPGLSDEEYIHKK